MFMDGNDPGVRCPLTHGMEVFGGKWKPRIICVLHVKGTLRYHELHDELCNISSKVLSSTLKELVSDGMVVRSESGCAHVNAVQYGLSEKGRSVVPILKSICEWSEMFVRDSNDDSIGICRRCDHRDV